MNTERDDRRAIHAQSGERSPANATASDTSNLRARIALKGADALVRGTASPASVADLQRKFPCSLDRSNIAGERARECEIRRPHIRKLSLTFTPTTEI